MLGVQPTDFRAQFRRIVGQSRAMTRKAAQPFERRGDRAVVRRADLERFERFADVDEFVAGRDDRDVRPA